MGKYFGTDGYRAEAGCILTADHAYRIGRFLGHEGRQGGRRVRVVIGKDTRRSGYMLEYALAAGLTASGADAYMLHVTTTPSVSYACRTEGFDFGVMISASHNPFYDNGIKLLNGEGEKLEEAWTERIEAFLDGDEVLPFAAGEQIGAVIDHAAGRNRYIAYLISLARHSYKGVKVALDCANGAAWMIGESVFRALGATVVCIGKEPNGCNINDGVGSTHPEALCALVKETGADIGFAFDGDADRCIAVDEQGQVVNGDHIMYLLATEMKREGTLCNNTVVTTVMSNLGLYRALEEAGIRSVQTAVGDRFVYENMRQTGNAVGGEQSGHIIVSKYATTGDGILTAILVMEAVMARKSPLSKLVEPVQMLPQVTNNIRTDRGAQLLDHPAVRQAVEQVRQTLGQRGRILLRRSGTEPLVRVMVEADTTEECRHHADAVQAVITSLLEEQV